MTEKAEILSFRVYENRSERTSAFSFHRKPRLYDKNLILDGPVDVHLAIGGNVDVEFQTYPIFSRVHSRLNGKHCAGEKLAVIVGFVVVQVGSDAVALMADAVAGAVHDTGAQSLSPQKGLGEGVHITAPQGKVLAEAEADVIQDLTADVMDNVKQPIIFRVNFGSHVHAPGNVIVDGVIPGESSRNVDDQAAAVPDYFCCVWGGFITRIASVLIDTEKWGRIHVDGLLVNETVHLLFQQPFINPTACIDTFSDPGKGPLQNTVDDDTGLAVALDLTLGQYRPKMLEQVCTGDGSDAEAFDIFQKPGVHGADGGHITAGGVLAGDLRAREKKPGEKLPQLSHAAVKMFLAGQMIKKKRLDGRQNFLRAVLDRNIIEETAGTGVASKGEKGLGDKVMAVKVRKQPSIQIPLFQQCLYFIYFHNSNPLFTGRYRTAVPMTVNTALMMVAGMAVISAAMAACRELPARSSSAQERRKSRIILLIP